MRISAGTAPPIVLLAVVGWAAWPYLESPGSTPTSKPQIAEVPSALLARVTNRAPDRDPFRAPATIDSAAKVPKAGPAADPLDRPARLVTPAQRKAELASRAGAEVRATLPGQVALSATSIRGKYRLAVLNGRTYSEGEAVEGIAAPGPVVLATVQPMSVRLRCGETTFDVAFSSASAATRPPPAVSTPPPARLRPTRGRGGAMKSNSVRNPTRPR